MRLFPREQTVGIFRGFSEGGLEFHADMVLPYRNEFQNTPMHGQFLIVQLENENEAVLGRITSISSEGLLTSGAGEDFGIRAVDDDTPIPEDLREKYLKYRVNIRVLGVIRANGSSLVFAPSHRRLPHVGSKVAFLCNEVLCEIAGHNIEGAELGYFALGEFVYSGGDKRLKKEPWMQLRQPTVISKFNTVHLVSRRTFVFARAGFGKSNLNKLLFSNLYKETPHVKKRGEREVPVGTIIFDPDGEYFWPDDKDRPGLCDVPELEDKIVVFTKKEGPSEFYGSFVAGSIKLDIRRLRPADVISIALSPEKQDQQNVRKLKGLNDNDWKQLVDEINSHGNASDIAKIKSLLRLEDHQDAEAVAARANMTTIVKMLHDPASQMMDMLIYALKQGKICVVDVSQMRGMPALILSGLILQRIFDHNQEEFTKAEPQTIPTIAVVEEAQSVLGNTGGSGDGPYVAWVKEGRKYDLGAVLITQQPGSISNEILSQGDNWFVFHLLSAGDLQSLKRANAHFSDDILSALLNEPIPGHCVFWSSSGGKSYPVPLRIMSFECLYKPRDPEYNLPPGNTYALELKKIFDAARPASLRSAGSITDSSDDTDEDIGGLDDGTSEHEDLLEGYIRSAIEEFKQSPEAEKIRRGGETWRGIAVRLEKGLPDVLHRKERIAFENVPRALNETFGDGNWKAEKRLGKSGKDVTWVILKK